MTKLCVCVEEEAGRRRPGIQNQKQEPHTKLWGKRDHMTHRYIVIAL